jgi:hypothetical protein
MRVSVARWVVAVGVGMLAGVSHGRPVAVAEDASAGEIVALVEAWIAAHPKDAEGYRVLGRVHALAWAYGETIPIVGTARREALPRFTELTSVLVSRTAPRDPLWLGNSVPVGRREERPVTAAEAGHLAASIAAYRRAVELDGDDALSALGLGWMLGQQGLYARQLPADAFEGAKATDAQKAAWGEWIGRLGDGDPSVREAASRSLVAAMPACARALREAPATDPEVGALIDAVFRGYFELQGLAHYRKAYALRAPADVKGEPTYQVDSQVSARAGAEILAVLGRHPEAAGEGEVKAVAGVVEALAGKWERLMRMPQ